MHMFNVTNVSPHPGSKELSLICCWASTGLVLWFAYQWWEEACKINQVFLKWSLFEDCPQKLLLIFCLLAPMSSLWPPKRSSPVSPTWLIFLSSPFKPLTHTYSFVYLYSPILKKPPQDPDILLVCRPVLLSLSHAPCFVLLHTCASAALKRSVLAGFRMVHQCQQPRESQPVLFLSQDNISHSS